MKAVRVQQVGGPEVLRAESGVAVPELGPKDILVKVAAAGVNFIDTYHRTGLYKMDTPFTPGREGAGTVTAVGAEVTRFRVGDRAAFLAPASYAEQVRVPEGRAVPVPEGVEDRQAAAVLLQGLTAHYLAHTTFRVRPGHTVLVHAGAGGTGGLLIQMIKLRGARVLTTVSTPEKAEIARSLGADHAILYTQDDFEAEVRRLTDGEGVDAVFDGVGKSTWEKSMRSLKRLGYLVLFGNASGAVPPVDPLLLTRHGSLFLTRPTLADHVATTEALEERTREVFGWIAEGKLRVRIAREFPLDQAKESHEFLASRAALGKILLLP